MTHTELDQSKLTVILQGKKITSPTSFSNKSNFIIKDCDFDFSSEQQQKDSKGNDVSTTMLTLNNCKNGIVLNCHFHNKKPKGLGLKIAGAGTNNVFVDNCEFDNLTYSAGNGGEPMRIGNSQHSGIWFDCTVRNSNFHDLKADVETISIKSCGNIIEHNHFKDNDSNVTVRHGGFATIQENDFEGLGGIRVIGPYNKIINNRFKNNKSSGDRAPIILAYANARVDPNFTAVDKPSGKEGRSHAMYAQVVGCEISGNVFENCIKTIVFRTGKPIAPENNKIENNKFGAIPITEPVDSNDGGEQHEVDPPQPEEENTPEDNPKTYLCAIDHVEEGKKRVSVYMCAEHAGLLAPLLQKVINEARKEAEAEEQADNNKDNELITGQ